MKTSNILSWLSIIIVLFTLLAAGVGLFWQDGGNSVSFITLRGETVQLYGQGIYRYDTELHAIGFKVADAVTLVLGIPTLVFALWLYRQGLLRGGMLLGGTLLYFLYYYGSLAFGAAYNNLFLVYLVLLTSSLWGVILVFASFDRSTLTSHFSERLPARGIGIYLIVAGVILILVWLIFSILPALAENEAPLEVASYTTIITFVIDMALVAPALIIAGAMIRRRSPMGLLLASILLIFTVILGINLLVTGVVQMIMGLMNMGQFIGFVVSFAILTLFAAGFTVRLLHSLVQEISTSPMSS